MKMTERACVTCGLPLDRAGPTVKYCTICAQPANRLLASRYGLSRLEYDRMLDWQSGKCAYCGRPPKAGRKLVVDHNHTTGQIRGLLCDYCNRRKVGKWQLDDANRLVGYLAYPPAFECFGKARHVPAGMEKPKNRRGRKRRRRPA